MVSMAWKISHLLLYIHKYTEDYLQEGPGVLVSGEAEGGAIASFMVLHPRLDSILKSSIHTQHQQLFTYK